MLDLWEYRRHVNEMYGQVRAGGQSSLELCKDFRQRKDELFRIHSQSPFTQEQQSRFQGLAYFEHDEGYNVWATAQRIPVDVEAKSNLIRIDLGADGIATLRHFANVEISLPTGTGSLALYWIEGYGGGLFLPFRDATNGHDTFGGGRYLLDTIKGADLGLTGTQIRLDFNYAYHPSCTYNPRWICPLAPANNRVSFPILAGERLAHNAFPGTK